jgi:hypothetical protein
LDIKQVFDGHRQTRERALTHLGLTGCLLQCFRRELHEGMLASWALRHGQAGFGDVLGVCRPSPDGLTGGDQVGFHEGGRFRDGSGCYNPKALQTTGAVF